MLYAIPLTAIWLVGCCTSPLLTESGTEFLVCEGSAGTISFVRASE